MFPLRFVCGGFVALLFQMAFLVGIAFYFFQIQNEIAAYSVIFGGLTYCVPISLANLSFGLSKAKTANLILTKAYIVTVYKLVSSACLFIYFFKYVNIENSAFLLGYVVVLLVQYVMSYVLLNITRQDI